jgi:prepilin-type N-terminal cleavage/methylation domain-containing protein
MAGQRVHKSIRGLTLVEILVALTLVAVVLLPVMTGLSQALVSTSQSTIESAATSVARDKVETIKDLVRRPGFDLGSLNAEPRVTANLKPGDQFFEVEVSTEVARQDTGVQDGVRKVIIHVYRRNSDSPVATVTTYFTLYGI